MGICRNTNGILSYTITNKNKKVFSITKEKSSKKNNIILSHEPYMTHNAVFVDDNILIGPAPAFTSFIKTVAFLKANADNLI